MLVDDLDFAVLDDVLDVVLVHRVGAQQLLDGVQVLGALAVLGVQVAALLLERGLCIVLRRASGDFGVALALHPRDVLADVGQHEQVHVGSRFARRHLAALVAHLDRMLLLVDRVHQRVVDVGHVLGVVLQVEKLRLLH